ncbi:MAG: phosphopyruvate hydratase [Pirellulales bacterium]
MPIQRVHAREVLDSRGHPTVEVEVHCDGGVVGSAIVPAGASTGQAEACELRDAEPLRYDGRGVRRAVENVARVLGPAIIGCDPREQESVDAVLIELDGTPQKSRLGGNALLGVSLAVAHAAAACDKIPLYQHIRRLIGEASADHAEANAGDNVKAVRPFGRMPLPMVNMISGGLHAGGNLDFQDFLIQPVGAPDYPTGLEWIVRVYRRLGELLSQAGFEGRLVGDEGGYGPRLASNRQAAEFVVRAIEAARLRPVEDVTLALDVASTHFFDGSHYRLAATGDARLTSDEMIDQLAALVDEFPIDSIEDGLAEDDWPGWQRLTARLGKRVRLVGDDLFTTNQRRLARGLELSAGNAVLIKVNQIGTLTETLQSMHLAGQHGWWRVVSARSGETEDSTIADLAVGAAGEQIKIGSIVRGERLAKYNRLLRIAEELER